MFSESEFMERYKEGQKLTFDSLKHLTTLSTGSILLLTALIKDHFKNPEWSCLIAVTLICFIVSIVSSVISMKCIAYTFFEPKDTSEKFVRVGSVFYFLSVTGFLVGIISLVIFTLKNYF